MKESENTWQEVDDGVGNVYYYNLISGESTWDRPEELDDKNESPNAPHTPQQTPQQEQQQEQPLAEEDEDEEEIEMLDGEADEWPVVDQMVGTIGSEYASRLGMNSKDYSALTGVKLDFTPLEDAGDLMLVKDNTHQVSVEEVRECFTSPLPTLEFVADIINTNSHATRYFRRRFTRSSISLC